MGPRGVGNPPHSSLPPSRPPDPSQFKLKLQAHKEEVAARFSKLVQSMTAFATEQENFRRELREEFRQLRLSYGEPLLPQPNPPTTTVSAPPPSSCADTPSSPSYCQSQLLKCQLPPPPSIPNCKPQSQILDPKPFASFTLLQDPFHTSPPRTVRPSLPPSPLVKPSSIPETIKPKFHSPTTLGTQAITHKGCVGVWRHGRVETHANDQGNRTTPSYVAFTDTERLISEVAKNQVTMNLINIVPVAQRLIGRKFSDSSVQGDMIMWLFKVFDKPMINVPYKGEEKQIATEEILFMVLIKMPEIQVILEGLKIRKDHELEHCFSGVDKRVCDKGGGHTFPLGNNIKVITNMSHDPQYWKSVLNGYIWIVFKHRSEHTVHTGNALLNVNYKVLLNGNGWQLVTKITLMKLKVDKAFMISSMVSYDGIGHQFILMVVEQIKYVFNKLFADLQTQEQMKTVSYKMVETPKRDTWAELICINGLNITVPMRIEFKLSNSKVGCWSAVQSNRVFIKLFVKVFVKRSIIRIGSACFRDASLLTFYIGNGKVTKFYETKLLVGIHLTAEENIESAIPLLLDNRFEILKWSLAIVFVEKLGGDGMRMFELLGKQGLKLCSQTLPAVLLSDGPIFDGGDCLDKSLTAAPNYVEIEQPDLYYRIKVDEVSCVLVLYVSEVINDSYIEKWRCWTSVTAVNKEGKIMRVVTNAGYELTYIEVSIGVCKFPQFVVNEITKLDELLHAMVGGECIGGVFSMLFLLDLVKTPTWTWEIDKLGADFNSKELKGTFNRLTKDSVINLLLIVYMAVIVCRNFLKLSLEHSKQVKVFSLQVSHEQSNCQQRRSYLTESKINQDAITCANTVRYWFNWKLLSWVTVYKLKNVIGNTKQWIGKRTVHKLSIKFYGPFEVLERIGTVAYKLRLPSSANIHPVFHVSLLKKKVRVHTVINPHRPHVVDPKNPCWYPAKVLDRMSVKKGGKASAKWLIQWVGSPMQDATWEFAEDVKMRYPDFGA